MHLIKRVFSLISLFFTVTVYANGITVIRDVHHDISKPLRDMLIPSQTTLLKRHHRIRPLLNRNLPFFTKQRLTDSALQTQTLPASKLLFSGYQGVGVGLGNYIPDVAPPDTNGSVGLTQYVQWVNDHFAVFDKQTGQVLPGYPKPGNILWSGFGGLCEEQNDGDPIVKYDQLANRWIFTQFAFNSPPFFQCVAVSTTSDATGSYYRYSFELDAFNDYTKLAVWPDAYYMTANMSNNGDQYYGPRVCALDRKAMLVGKPASMQCAQASNEYATLLAGDLDGRTLPPANTPEYLLTLVQNNLALWKYKVDWNNSNNTTFSGPFFIPVANFNYGCQSAGTDDCAPQPNVNQGLDVIGRWLMYRLPYRQFNNYASMVVTHTVDTTNNVLAIRWYELRVNNDNTFMPYVYQQGTYSPDTKGRFMGSAAMDKHGNITVGYSVSSKSLYPSIAVASRISSDPLGKLRPETRIITGTGSQTDLGRWGDYSSMAVDPVDDCTMWYTNEYLKTTGSFNWSTFIAKFRISGC